MERDFKYLNLISDSHSWEEALASLSAVKSPCLRACADAFMANMTRNACFAAMPCEIFFQATRNTRLSANAIFSALGVGKMTLQEHVSTNPTPGLELAFAKEAEEWERVGLEIHNKLRLQLGVGSVETYLKKSAEMRDSMDALLTSIVLESWLFFEAFASDIWVAAVDNATPTIAAQVISFTGWDKSEMLAGSLTQANASTHPGSYRREIGQVTFQKLRNIRRFFEAAFGREASRLLDDTAGGYICALSSVRNCVAHCAGKRDSAFDRSLGGRTFPEFANFKIGDKILLDGEFVKKLRNTAIEVGAALVHHVDGLLLRGD